MRQNIYGAFISSGNTYRLSFYQLINRLCVLVQLPIYVVLYKKERGIYQRVDSTLARDEIYRSEIIKVCNAEYIFDEVSVARKNQSGNFFRVFGTSFYIIVFYLDGYDKLDNNRPVLTRIQGSGDGIISTNTDYIYYSIRNVLFSHVESDNKKHKVPESLKKYINRSVRNVKYTDTKETPSYCSVINKEKITLGVNICSEIHGRFSESIKLISGICQNGDYNGPPNILIFARNYDTSNSSRAEIYKHNVNIISCEGQDSIIVESLKKLFSTNILTDKDRNYLHCHYDNNLNIIDEGKYQEAIKSHNFFIDLIEERKDIDINGASMTGYSALIEIFKSNFGKDTASIADSTFYNNTAQFREIFKDGGLNRVGCDDEYDRLRVIFCYYFFESLSEPEEKNEDLFMMLLPMQVGGSTWGVIGNVVKINPEKTYLNKNNWDQIYYLFQDIAISIEKELRRNLLDLYMQDIFYRAYIFRNELIISKFKIPVEGLSLTSAFTKIITSNESDSAGLLREFNIVFDDLTKFYPFPKIELSLKKTAKNGNFLNKYEIKIKANNKLNTFDYEEGTRDFMSKNLIKKIDKIIRLESKQIINDLVTYRSLDVD